MSEIYDATPCELGEGPLWHPVREELLWFDILGRQLLIREGDKTRRVSFQERPSAAGWVSDGQVLIATERRFLLFDLDRERIEDVAGLEPDEPRTRSNDGRADPWGGFWVSTMGKKAEAKLGAIYRYYRGEVRRVIPDLAVPNSIAFTPDRSAAYYADSLTGQIMKQPLEALNGWPDGEAEVFLDLRGEALIPDGSVVDAAGNLWNAQWGAWRVACYSPEGEFLCAVSFDAAHTSCPAFGGAGLSTLFCTTARENLSESDLANSDKHGCTFAAPETGTGLPEYQVVLG